MSESAVPRSLPWPDRAPVLGVDQFRDVIARLSSLAMRHPERVVLLGAGVDAEGDGELAGDPPPALEQIVEELGGVEVDGTARLDLLVDERVDVGPYTLLGDATTYYPLYEGEDVAIVLTLDEDGAPGAVLGIGDDLAMTLVALDLRSFLERWADALEATVESLTADTGNEGSGPDPEAAEALMGSHLLREALGDVPERTTVRVTAPSELEDAEDLGLPAGTVAVADLRGAALGTVVELMDAPLPGGGADILDLHVAFTADGLVIALVGDAA